MIPDTKKTQAEQAQDQIEISLLKAHQELRNASRQISILQSLDEDGDLDRSFLIDVQVSLDSNSMAQEPKLEWRVGPYYTSPDCVVDNEPVPAFQEAIRRLGYRAERRLQLTSQAAE